MQVGFPAQNVIALTGIIGSGKSTVAKLMREAGAHVISADEITHEILSTHSRIKREIFNRYGEKVFTSKGLPNRKILGGIIFESPKDKEWIEKLLHPLIREKAAECIEELKDKGKPIVYEIPLLFETGMQFLSFKAIVVVSAPEDLCIERILSRDDVSHVEAKQRFRSQIPLEEKLPFADFTIENSGKISELKKKVSELMQKISSGDTSNCL